MKIAKIISWIILILITSLAFISCVIENGIINTLLLTVLAMVIGAIFEICILIIRHKK